MNNKKAIIYTLNHLNYGAVLQCCGLVNYLRGIGIDAESINLNFPYHQKLFRVFGGKDGSPVRKMILNAFRLLRYRALKRKIDRTVAFRNQWLHLSGHAYVSEEELLNNPPAADFHISGSDQVFRPENPRRRIYYLDFKLPDGQQKIAYAPSFGTDRIAAETAEILRPWIKDFAMLSARESSGAGLLAQLGGSTPPTVLDPVFLPDESFWLAIAGERPVREKYIIVYELNGGRTLIDKANRISARLHLPVYVITTKPQKFYPVKRQLYDCGPQEFISYIRHAEYVVTDSFHGTSFALIFKRSFAAMTALAKSSDRLKTLLGSVGEQHRLISPEDDVPEENSNPPAPEAYKRLDELRQHSKAYLNQAVFGSNIRQ